MTIQSFEKAVRAHRSATIRVGPHKVKLYCGHKGKQKRYTLCWYEGLKRQRLETCDCDVVLGATTKVIEAFQRGATTAASLSQARIQEFIEAEMFLSGVNLVELAKHYAATRTLETTSVAQAVAMFLESCSNRSPRYCRSLVSQLNRFKRHFCGPIGNLTTEAIDDFLRGIPHPKTRLNYRRTLGTLFKFGQRKGFVPQGLNAVEKTDRPHVPVNGEPHTMSAEDLKTLLTAAIESDRKLGAFLAIGAFAGIRSAEIQRLLWRDVQPDGIVMSTSKTKTGRRRIAEVSPNLNAWLNILREGQDEDGFVTYSEIEGSRLYKRLSKLCKKNGVGWPQNGLRHTFVSCHLELHRDPPRTAKTSGHSLSVLENSYLKLIPRDQAAEWFEIYPNMKKREAQPKRKKALNIVEFEARLEENIHLSRRTG